MFFQLMITIFKENLNLQLPFIFYSSAMFLFETAFISEQIAEIEVLECCKRLVTNLSPI